MMIVPASLRDLRQAQRVLDRVNIGLKYRLVRGCLEFDDEEWFTHAAVSLEAAGVDFRASALCPRKRR